MMTFIYAVPSWAFPLANFGFETRDTTGWTEELNNGQILVTPSHNGSDDSVVYSPQEGNYFLRLQAGAADTVVNVYQDFSLFAGQSITGMAAFDARDYDPYNDRAFVQIFEAGTDFSSTLWEASVLQDGNHVNAPWEEWRFTAETTGEYRLTYGVVNDDDALNSSYALFDARQEPVVPEPASMMLFATGLLGAAGSRLRSARKRSS